MYTNKNYYTDFMTISNNELFTQNAQRIRDVIRYIKRFKNATVVIHIDDRVLESSLFTSHISDIAMMHDAGLKVVIVPGAKKRIDDVLKLNNVDWQLKDGFRITEENSIPLIKMAAFDVSNKIMTALSGNGLTALIGNWVRSRAKGIIEGFDYGICGEIDKIHIEALNKVLDDGFIPIFPCIGWSASGKPYNISSIKLACETAIKLNADKLFFLTPDCSITSSEFNISSEMPLSPEGCVPALNLEELDKFLLDNKDNSSSVINLLKNGLETCKKGVSRVHILNGQIDGTLPCEIFSDLGSGTMIYKSNYGGIRKMQIDDTSSVLTLMRPFIEKGILLNRTEQDLQDTFSDFIVYELDGAIRACASLHLYDDLQGEIAAIAVDKNCSHMGIGPKLVSYLIEEAKKESAKSVFVLTTQTSDWFEKLGFIPDDIETLPEKRKALWTKKRNSKLLRLNLS